MNFSTDLLRDKTALVPMPTFGMGMEIAEQLGHAGAAVVINSGLPVS